MALSNCTEKIMKIPLSDVNSLIEAIIQSICVNNYQNIKPQALSNKLKLNLTETENLLGYLIQLSRQLLHWSSHSETELKQNLQEIGFTEEWIGNISKTVTQINTAKLKNGYVVQYDKLIWRIDISLCSSTLKKALSPTILWNLRLKNGKKYTIELSLKKYHELRFNVASLLKEIFVLNNNSLVKK